VIRSLQRKVLIQDGFIAKINTKLAQQSDRGIPVIGDVGPPLSHRTFHGQIYSIESRLTCEVKVGPASSLEIVIHGAGSRLKQIDRDDAREDLGILEQLRTEHIDASPAKSCPIRREIGRAHV